MTLLIRERQLGKILASQKILKSANEAKSAKREESLFAILRLAVGWPNYLHG